MEYGKALCKAIGSTKKGAIEVTFDDETMLDLMAEQGTWPIIYHVFDESFKLLAETMGHPEEAVLMEAYLSKEPMYMMEKAAELGMYRQMPFHSHTSQFGQLRSFHTFDPTPIREFLRDRYDQIKDGLSLGLNGADYELIWVETERDAAGAARRSVFCSPIRSRLHRIYCIL